MEYPLEEKKQEFQTFYPISYWELFVCKEINHMFLGHNGTEYIYWSYQSVYTFYNFCVFFFKLKPGNFFFFFSENMLVFRRDDINF